MLYSKVCKKADIATPFVTFILFILAAQKMYYVVSVLLDCEIHFRTNKKIQY